MEIIRLRRENINLEKKNKELLAQISELSTKNNSLSKQVLSLKYSNKDNNSLQYSNNIIITELNKTISELTSKLNQANNEKNKLEKMNKDLKASLNINHIEIHQKQNINREMNNNFSDIKKLNEIINKDKNQINELKQINNNLNKQISKFQNENDKIKREIIDINNIKEDYKERYYKLSKELNEEKELNLFNEQKIKKLERKLEEYNINDFDDSKTKTYKINKINKVNEIEVEKLTKKFYNSPPNAYRKNTSTFSTNSTSNNRRILANNLDEIEISPENYTIIKQFKLSNNLKWNLLKKIRKQNSGLKEENNSPKSSQASKHQYRRFHYLKLNSKSNHNIFNDDSYSDFIWKPNKNEKDFINFNMELIENDLNDNSISREKQKKINDLKTRIKDLEEKLEKKENDCNRINLNYAKLFKRSKIPELSYDKLLENIEKLKNENKNLNKKIENLKINQNFIGFSFIEDDLEGSRFIDDKCFEEILNEIDKKSSKKQTNDINMMKYFNSHEDERSIRDSEKEKEKDKDIIEKSDKKREKRYLFSSKSRKSLNDDNKNYKIEQKNEGNKDDNKCIENEMDKENKNIIRIKSLLNKAHINYFRNDINSPKKNENNNIKENKTDENKNKINEVDNSDKKLKNIYDNKNETIIVKNWNNFHKKTNSSGKEIKTELRIENNNDKNSRIYPRTTRYRRTYNSIIINSMINSENNINENKNNESKIRDNKIIKNKINQDDKSLKDIITIKKEDEKQIKNMQNDENKNENTIKLNRYCRGRRFYKRKNENINTLEIDKS